MVQENDWFEQDNDYDAELPGDERQVEARQCIVELVEGKKAAVWFSRQIEVLLEAKFFHWITNRAVRELVEEDFLKTEVRNLKTGGEVHLVWHRGNRYYRREAAAVVKLVDAYADSNVAGAIGLHGEAMVLEGFARSEFVMRGRNTNSYGGRTWQATGHTMDFIFEKDRRAYGIEVKNTLGYMEHEELEAKVRMCRYLRVRPVFVARMLPKSWIREIVDAGGFALILKYQLYPWTHRELAKAVKSGLGLPVDAPRALEEGTMRRFVRWHERA